MTRKRDLSGFGGGGGNTPGPAKVAPRRPPAPPSQEVPIVPPPKSPSQDPAIVPPPTSPTTKASRAKVSSSSRANQPKGRSKEKQRITLSLPTSVAGLLRATADRENRIYLDIILQAFVDHSTAIDETFVERRRSGEVRTTGGRRRADSGRTQIPLNILKEDLGELDHRAKALSLDRSAYVTELLVRSLKR